MPEQQNIEYKQSWHDDYLKWVCGFANAQGGVIFIGKDDNGKVVGLADYKRLMEDIPNKIKNAMGITAEVNLHEEQRKHFIEIITPPYSVPISLRGRYYYRSGSTKQELTGTSLNEFLLKKSGKTWDDVVETRATFDDIDERTVKIFLAASQNTGRLPENDGLSIPELFEKLRLTENGQLKRAAVIFFGKDPGKFYPGIYVKIGRFGKSDTDIIFQEMEEGNLIVLLQAVLNQLNHKFLIRSIEFEGMHRIEKGEYPLPALREMLLNALVHRNYMGAPIQIRVYDDKISIWNEGTLPAGLTLDALKRSHSSRPRNPIIADVAFKGGYIDAWGRGTIKIIDTCKEAELPEPEMQELDGGFSITLFKNTLTEEKLTKLGLNARQIKAVLFVKEKGKITNKEYQEINETSDRTALRDLENLIELNVFVKEGEKKGTNYKLKFGG
jgi:ATP-dependent DNA helicase RecG